MLLQSNKARPILLTVSTCHINIHSLLLLSVTNFCFLFVFFCRFSSRFEIPLLVQSVVMNITMFIMIHLCVTVRRNNAIMRTRERVFSGRWPYCNWGGLDLSDLFLGFFCCNLAYGLQICQLCSSFGCFPNPFSNQGLTHCKWFDHTLFGEFLNLR